MIVGENLQSFNVIISKIERLQFMNRFFSGSLMTLGALFVVVIFIGIGFYIASSQNSGTPFPKSIVENKKTNTDTATIDSHDAESTPFVLSAAQKQAMSSFGIDPNTIPSTVSREQEACFTDALGGEKVAEIKAGGIPSALDFFKAKGCI